MSTSPVEAPAAIHKILIATDFTETSRKAFHYAKALARHFQVPVIAAHVLRASVRDWPRFDVDPEYKKLWLETKRDLDSLYLQLHQAGFQADRVLLEGDPAEEILKGVKEYKADLLVLGTHGPRNVERLVLGSTAEEILRKASCPVLTVGPKVNHPPRHGLTFKRILLATGLHPEQSVIAQYAFSIAAGEDALVCVCHVLLEGHTKTMDAVEMQAEFVKAVRGLVPASAWEKCAVEYVVEHGSPADEILKLAKEKQADLIVLGAHPASALATHLVPGVAFRVIAGASCPVLTVRG